MSSDENRVTGSCLCGAVRYEVSGPLREIIMCHCVMCQKSSGHHFAATATENKNLQVFEEGALKWFKSSDHAERGFCNDCGSSLFWRMFSTNSTSILAGTLDGDVTLPVSGNYFVSTKKGYYKLEEGIAQYDTYPIEI